MNTIYINFNSGISETVVNKFMGCCSEMLALTPRPELLYLLFSSSGGNVNPGITLYNFLRALPCKIVIHNTGSVDSVSTAIFHAADERLAAPHTSFLFHGVTWNFAAAQSVNMNQMKESLSILTDAENKIANIISSRCQLTQEEIRQLFLRGETKDTTFALEKGIIQAVSEPKIPADARLFSFVA